MTTTNKTQVDALTKAGFAPAQTKVRRRLIVSIEGEEKTGKDHFAFTAPDPIGVQSFDDGLEGVVEKFVNGLATAGGIAIPKKQILVKEYRLPPNLAAEPNFDYTSVWAAFVKDYRALLAAGVRTVIWDTATELWELLRMLRFGKLAQVQPHNYGPVNGEYVGLLREAYNAHSNLILLHSTRAEYVNDKATGKKERAGFNATGFKVQVNLKTFRVDSEEGSEFSIKVLDCRQNGQLNGMLYEGMMATFPFLAVDVIEDSDLSEWE